jgi:NitT/TauT family transport system ATP-binding protein
MARTKVQIRDLTIDYVNEDRGEHHRAIDSLSLDVYENEFLCVVGPSGCGKSTLIAAIAGFLRPAAGQLSMDGRRITGPGADRGVVFQEYALLPWNTVIDNVALGLKIRGVPRAERHEVARRFLGMTNLVGAAQKYPHELSGGMKQRVAIARALANEPRILIMDEPFAALDAQTREIMQSELLRIWRESGKTVLFITHQINEAIYLADRVIIFGARPGKVKETIKIDIPRPRDLSVKRDSSFLKYEDRVWNLIEEEVKKTMIQDQVVQNINR